MFSKMVQIRNVPEEFHRRLKARAAQEGMSMSDYILRVVGNALDVPTDQEIFARLRAQQHPPLRPSAAEILRQERDRR